MDLDNIKKTWQQAELNPAIGEDKIQKMLDNKGQTAFGKLLSFEKLGLILAILCIPLSLVFKEPAICIFYLCSMVLALFWQLYKYRFLKRIDPMNMGVLDISHSMTTYRKYLRAEFIVGAVWVIVFALICYFLVFYKADMARYGACSGMSVVFIAIIVVLPLICAWMSYKYLYLSNIKKLEEAIKEVEEFKEGNH
jgi:hypothetical protein